MFCSSILQSTVILQSKHLLTRVPDSNFEPELAELNQLKIQVILDLLSHKPAILRGNASEIFALAGASGVSKGVDSTAEPWDALEAGKQLAKRHNLVVAISGKEDLVSDQHVTCVTFMRWQCKEDICLCVEEI